MNAESSEEFGEQLRRYRLDAGLTQEALAERAGLSVRGISDLERGARRLPRIDTIRRLAQVLKLSRQERTSLIAAGQRPPTRPAFTPLAAPPDDGPRDAPDRSRRRALGTVGGRFYIMPLQPTALVGRARDVADVRALVRDGARLVTLTGPGGVGKTRLALQIATEMADDFEHGTVLVELASIVDPKLVPSTIAQVLGARDIGGRPVLENLKDYLATRSLLLLLDNFEQLLPAAPVVAELLASSPRLSMLVTSREPLHLRAERAYAVAPLRLPDMHGRPIPDEIAQAPACRLFVERATAIRSDFALTPENAPAIAEVCRCLDGLPLAIELAAARVRLLSPQAMVGRLTHRLPLLTGGARDLPTRQRTLRSTIDWSHELLNDAERRLFRRLAVFMGGWTLGAAEAICDLADLDGDVLDGLDSLVSKSLVRQDESEGGAVRFRMLETIREYGLEQLEASDEATALRQRHAAYFVTFADEAAQHLHETEQVVWLKRLNAEHDNLRAALAWSRAGDDREIGLRLVGALAWFWLFRGHASEARAWQAEMLMAPTGTRQMRAAALFTGALFAVWQGDYGGAHAFARESETLFSECGDLSGVGWAHVFRGVAALAESSHSTAQVLFGESMALCEQAGNRCGVAFAISQLGAVAYRQGDSDRALALREQAAAISRQVGERWTLGLSLIGIASIVRQRGDVRRSASLCREALVALSELGDLWALPRALGELAITARLDGDAARAARLLGAMEALREAGGTREMVNWRMVFEPETTLVRTSLGSESFSAAWAEGRAMTLEQAVAYALDECAASS